MNLNEQAKIIHEGNAKWWVDLETGLPIQRNKKELLALVISELIEALEGERKNLMDDKLPHRKMAEVEMADAYIRILDYAGGFSLALDKCLPIPVPENKGEAIFDIIDGVSMIFARNNHEDVENYWLSSSLQNIRDYCNKHGYDLDGAVAEKLHFNATRIDHTPEARKLANGKKF